MLPGSDLPLGNMFRGKPKVSHPPMPVWTGVVTNGSNLGNKCNHNQPLNLGPDPSWSIVIQETLLPFHTQVLHSSLIFNTTYIIARHTDPITKRTHIHHHIWWAENIFKNTDKITVRVWSTPNKALVWHYLFLMAMTLPTYQLSRSWDCKCCLNQPLSYFTSPW